MLPLVFNQEVVILHPGSRSVSTGSLSAESGSTFN